ncbi:MAG: acetylglutamate kinase [Candidatus Eisenbacteria bacterium]
MNGATRHAAGQPGGALPGAPTAVVKLGGRALDTPGALATFARAVAGAATPPVLVHGGGSEVSAWCTRLGVEARFIDGLRVTDDATLEIAAAVLAGLANKRLVATLRDAGADAVGLSALDGGIVGAGAHPDHARLGRVGTVETVDTTLLVSLLDRGHLPVLASIGAHEGALLNLNADDVAAALAAALGGPLVLLSDTPGLALDGALVSRVRADGIEALATHPDVRGGMRPKLLAARRAVAGGARFARITHWDPAVPFATLVAEDGPGTSVVRGPAHAPAAHPHPIGDRA